MSIAEDLYCFRCGESLGGLTPPISRQDACPSCGCHLHVCRMCVDFDPDVPAQCREDDAEEVFDKEKSNFCDWFKPSPDAFDAKSKRADDTSRTAAEALFGGEVNADADKTKRAPRKTCSDEY